MSAHVSMADDSWSEVLPFFCIKIKRFIFYVIVIEIEATSCWYLYEVVCDTYIQSNKNVTVRHYISYRYANIVSYRVTSGVIFSIDQSATSLPNCMPLIIENMLRVDVRLVYVYRYNCLVYDWTVRNQWKVYPWWLLLFISVQQNMSNKRTKLVVLLPIL